MPDSPAPDGLGINAATAKVVMEEVDDRKLLREVVAAVPPLPEREHGIEGGKAGPGRGKKTGPARLGHRTKDPCLATRTPAPPSPKQRSHTALPIPRSGASTSI